MLALAADIEGWSILSHTPCGVDAVKATGAQATYQWHVMNASNGRATIVRSVPGSSLLCETWVTYDIDVAVAMVATVGAT